MMKSLYHSILIMNMPVIQYNTHRYIYAFKISFMKGSLEIIHLYFTSPARAKASSRDIIEEIVPLGCYYIDDILWFGIINIHVVFFFLLLRQFTLSRHSISFHNNSSCPTLYFQRVPSPTSLSCLVLTFTVNKLIM